MKNKEFSMIAGLVLGFSVLFSTLLSWALFQGFLLLTNSGYIVSGIMVFFLCMVSVPLCVVTWFYLFRFLVRTFFEWKENSQG